MTTTIESLSLSHTHLVHSCSWLFCHSSSRMTIEIPRAPKSDEQRTCFSFQERWSPNREANFHSSPGIKWRLDLSTVAAEDIFSGCNGYSSVVSITQCFIYQKSLLCFFMFMDRHSNHTRSPTLSDESLSGTFRVVQIQG